MNDADTRFRGLCPARYLLFHPRCKARQAGRTSPRTDQDARRTYRHRRTTDRHAWYEARRSRPPRDRRRSHRYRRWSRADRWPRTDRAMRTAVDERPMTTSTSQERVIDPESRWLAHYHEASRRRRSRGWHRQRDDGARRRLGSNAVVLIVLGCVGIVGAILAAILARWF